MKEYLKRHPANRSKNPVKKVFDEWIKYALQEKDIEKNTADRYQNDYDKFIDGTDFSKMDIESVEQKDVVRFLKDTINDNYITRKVFSNIKTVLNGIFSYAMSEMNLNCISMSYTLKDFKVSDKKFKKIIVKDEEQVFNEEEVVKISEYILSNYSSTREFGVLLALLTALRVGELSSLKYTDQENGRLYIQRTEIKYENEDDKTVYAVREFPKSECSMNGIELSDSAIKVLAMIRKLNMKNGINSEYLFYEENYGRLKSYFFSKALKKVCKAVGIKYRSMHKLRKTYASYLLANGVEEKIAQSQLRHKDSATTHKYYEFSIRNKEYKRAVLNENDILQKSNIV
ncbi:MAG: site-specific integrase [Lachnospiraceae bacterium]|nr:site-specific integrase [Lachnospiraceae bacterium]